ncbi:MAG: hypothetical protein R2942_16960 [Ignavibacteria bacterium]
MSSIGDAIGRTTDGGFTFTKIVTGSGSQNVYGFYFLNSNTGYARKYDNKINENNKRRIELDCRSEYPFKYL